MTSHSPEHDPLRIELEAATFRRLVAHLQAHPEVQNIDLMNLAGFCRNCLAKWYRAEAEARGETMSDPDARALVYGMPYETWKTRYQTGPKVSLPVERGGEGHHVEVAPKHDP